MIKYFKTYKSFTRMNFFYIIIDDKEDNYNIGLKIIYDNKNKIFNVILLNKLECKVLSQTLKEHEIDAFEFHFNNDYLNLLKSAISFYDKKYEDVTILDKIVKKYNLLNLNE